MRLLPYQADYPALLKKSSNPPEITVSGPLDPTARCIAIVGSRAATAPALAFAQELAGALARAGFVVVSGGALGVDRAAHDGARAAGGATWVVACHGRHAPAYPSRHDGFYRSIAADPRSRMIWPFGDHRVKDLETPRDRNGILVGVAERLVVVQARRSSGSLNAARWARTLGRPVHAVPAAPWELAFAGTLDLIRAKRAAPVWSAEELVRELVHPEIVDLAPSSGMEDAEPQDAWSPGFAPASTARPLPTPTPIVTPPIVHADERGSFPSAGGPAAAPLTDEESAVFSCIFDTPTQQEEIVARSGLGFSSTVTALLTLSLRDVVVEGPDGFFRRRISP